MSREIKYCYEDQTIDEVTQNMGELRIRRLPVLTRDKRLVGILSLGDLAIDEERARRSGRSARRHLAPGRAAFAVAQERH